jgi:hypothetical protein
MQRKIGRAFISIVGYLEYCTPHAVCMLCVTRRFNSSVWKVHFVSYSKVADGWKVYTEYVALYLIKIC